MNRPPLRAALALAFIVMGSFGLAGCQTATPTADPADEEGAKLYISFCATCHGVDGHSLPTIKDAPSLNNPELLSLLDDDTLRRTISDGRPGMNGREKPGTKMPIFGAANGGPMSALQIDAVVAHVARWRSKPILALDDYIAHGNVASGAALYATLCAKCHGPDGWGTDAPRLAGQTFQHTYSDAMIRHVILNGRTGTLMAGIPLSETAVADVISFVRSLSGTVGTAP